MGHAEANNCEVEDRRFRHAMLDILMEQAKEVQGIDESLLEKAGARNSGYDPHDGLRLMNASGCFGALPYACGLKSFIEVFIDLEEPVWRLKQKAREAHAGFGDRDLKLEANGREFDIPFARLTAYDLRDNQTVFANPLKDPAPPPTPPQRDGEIYVLVSTNSGASAYVSVSREATAAVVLALAAAELPEDVGELKRLMFKAQRFEPLDTLASKGVTDIGAVSKPSRSPALGSGLSSTRSALCGRGAVACTHCQVGAG